ncbi:hypothetical protein ERO13_D05G230850v2 [Gossypium hirsutum]|nr:hypothetical protein ERO13_D05G230850v2 [Gossypium hirsutum]
MHPSLHTSAKKEKHKTNNEKIHHQCIYIYTAPINTSQQLRLKRQWARINTQLIHSKETELSTRKTFLYLITG